MNFVPLDDRILIEPIEEKEKTGILAIPDAVREKPLSGKVIAIGNDVADGATIPLYKLVEKWNKRAEELISENLDSLIFKCI